MDAMLAKVLESRRKSVTNLDKEILELTTKKRGATTANVVLMYDSLIKVRQSRRDKLTAEIAALVEESQRQTEIPGTESHPEPTPQAAVLGRKR